MLYLCYLNSWVCSSSLEDRDICQKVDTWLSTGRSNSISLLKLKLDKFDKNPLERSEWFSLFIATVAKQTTPYSKKLSQLKTLLTGKTKSAVSGMGHFGGLFSAFLNKIRCATREPAKSKSIETSWLSILYSVYLLLYLILRTYSKKTNNLVICNQIQFAYSR